MLLVGNQLVVFHPPPPQKKYKIILISLFKNEFSESDNSSTTMEIDGHAYGTCCTVIIDKLSNANTYTRYKILVTYVFNCRPCLTEEKANK